jgi:hypothetical protein
MLSGWLHGRVPVIPCAREATAMMISACMLTVFLETIAIMKLGIPGDAARKRDPC